jgi:hypothetical protein
MKNNRKFELDSAERSLKTSLVVRANFGFGFLEDLRVLRIIFKDDDETDVLERISDIINECGYSKFFGASFQIYLSDGTCILDPETLKGTSNDTVVVKKRNFSK